LVRSDSPTHPHGTIKIPADGDLYLEGDNQITSTIKETSLIPPVIADEWLLSSMLLLGKIQDDI